MWICSEKVGSTKFGWISVFERTNQRKHGRRYLVVGNSLACSCTCIVKGKCLLLLLVVCYESLWSAKNELSKDRDLTYGVYVRTTHDLCATYVMALYARAKFARTRGERAPNLVKVTSVCLCAEM